MPSVCIAMSGYFLFGPAQACLNGLTIILSYEFHTCSFIHAYTTCLQISFMHGCIVSLMLIVQKDSSMMCLSQKCYQSCIFQVAGPTKTVVYQCLFISPVFSLVWSLPHWGNWRYFPFVCWSLPNRGNWRYFPFVCWSLPHRGNWQYFPFVCWSLPHRGNWRYFPFVCWSLPHWGNWRCFLLCVSHYSSQGNRQFFLPSNTYQFCSPVRICPPFLHM